MAIVGPGGHLLLGACGASGVLCLGACLHGNEAMVRPQRFVSRKGVADVYADSGGNGGDPPWGCPYGR